MGGWGLNLALTCPYDNSGTAVRCVGRLNALAGCYYHKRLISVRSLKSAIQVTNHSYTCASYLLLVFNWNRNSTCHIKVQEPAATASGGMYIAL